MSQCNRCGLPFQAAAPVIPLIAGAVAGTIFACSGDACSLGEKVGKGILAGGVTALLTAGLQSAASHVCQCDVNLGEEHA